MLLSNVTESNIKRHIGKLIRETRKAKGLTQKELGERIGVAESTLSRFENGDQNLTLETLGRISDALEKDLYIEFR